MGRVNETADVQALSNFGVAFAINSAFTVSKKGVATAATGTTITGTTGDTHTTDDCKGALIYANTAADWSGTVLMGLCTTNSNANPCVYTVDHWYTVDGASSASSPASTSPFIVSPTTMPFWYAALSDDVAAVTASVATGAAIPETGGKVEITTNGLGRAKITTVGRTHATTGTMTLSVVFTYTGSSNQNIGRAALVNSLQGSKGFAMFIDQINGGTPAAVANNGDTFTPTWTVTIA